MFPTDNDIADAAERFGRETEISRVRFAGDDGCHGTSVCVALTPDVTREGTLRRAWAVMREMARWLLERREAFPDSERFGLIVFWSKAVRPCRGQIFKAGWTADDLRVIAGAGDWPAFEAKTGRRALLPTWEKDVFATRAPDPPKQRTGLNSQLGERPLNVEMAPGEQAGTAYPAVEIEPARGAGPNRWT